MIMVLYWNDLRELLFGMEHANFNELAETRIIMHNQYSQLLTVIICYNINIRVRSQRLIFTVIVS